MDTVALQHFPEKHFCHIEPTIETCFLIRSKAGFFLILEKILANDLYSATFKVLFTEIYHVNPHISNNSHYIKYAYP